MKAISSEELSYQYIPWYVRDYLEDVECDVLSAAAEGCRLRLVLRQWLQGSIPANPAVLRKLTKATEAEWVTVWPEIEHHFPVIEDGAARRNPKFHALRLDREVFLEGKRQLGAKGGKAGPRSTVGVSKTSSTAIATVKQVPYQTARRTLKRTA